MTFNQAAVIALYNSVRTHCMSPAVVDVVTTHETRAKPVAEMSAEIWGIRIDPSAQASGLDATAGVVTFNIRVRTSMLAKPEDDIDAKLLTAVSAIIGEYSGNFTLAGTVMAIDLLGMHGAGLSAQLGYLEHDGTQFRIATLTMPIVIDNMWTQGA